MVNLVLTVVGDDRPGLVSALAKAVADRGGNWLKGDMARLGGKFAGVLLVDVDDAAVDALTADLQGLGVLDVSVSRTEEPDVATSDRWTLTLVGNDRPGIVREVAGVLASSGVSIDDLETGTREAPMTGGVLFEAKAVLSAPAGVERAQVAEALESIAQELMVDVELGTEDEPGV
ncbi:glycine cleavage system transcriptional repressor [Mariniluteicoccus flavus]